MKKIFKYVFTLTISLFLTLIFCITSLPTPARADDNVDFSSVEIKKISEVDNLFETYLFISADVKTFVIWMESGAQIVGIDYGAITWQQDGSEVYVYDFYNCMGLKTINGIEGYLYDFSQTVVYDDRYLVDKQLDETDLQIRSYSSNLTDKCFILAFSFETPNETPPGEVPSVSPESPEEETPGELSGGTAEKEPSVNDENNGDFGNLKMFFWCLGGMLMACVIILILSSGKRKRR